MNASVHAGEWHVWTPPPVHQVFYAATPQTDYLHSAIVTVLQIHQELDKEKGYACVGQSLHIHTCIMYAVYSCLLCVKL